MEAICRRCLPSLSLFTLLVPLSLSLYFPCECSSDIYQTSAEGKCAPTPPPPRSLDTDDDTVPQLFTSFKLL